MKLLGAAVSLVTAYLHLSSTSINSSWMVFIKTHPGQTNRDFCGTWWRPGWKRLQNYRVHRVGGSVLDRCSVVEEKHLFSTTPWWKNSLMNTWHEKNICEHLGAFGRGNASMTGAHLVVVLEWFLLDLGHSGWRSSNKFKNQIYKWGIKCQHICSQTTK